MIPFNKPPLIGTEQDRVLEAIKNQKLSGDGPFTKQCQSWFEQQLDCAKALITPSCTHALEMMALLLDVKPGDEVIMPSYTFSSTANAFALRGAHIVFVDIRQDTMNIDEQVIEEAIGSKTKGIMVMHYAGVSCEMDSISKVAEQHGLWLVEDAAQGMMANYQGKPLGTMGCMGAFSFHETKNYSCGEGGLLIINDKTLVERAEIIREKGTNRSKFFRGMVDKYSWVDIGSSYLCSDINAAYLSAQLDEAEKINRDRLESWHYYYQQLQPLEAKGHIQLPGIPEACSHNAHMFYLKTKDLHERAQLIDHLEKHNVKAVFHYIPLHSSPAGKVCGSFNGTDTHTTTESEKLIRLPMYFGLSKKDADLVIAAVKGFFE